MKLQEVQTVVEDRVPLVDLGDWEEGRREGAPGLGPLLWSADLPTDTRGRDTTVTLGCVFLWAQGPGGRLWPVELAQKPVDWSRAFPGARHPSLLSLCAESILQMTELSTDRQRGFLAGCFWGAVIWAEPMKGHNGSGQDRAAGSGCSRQARSATLPPLPLTPQLYQSIVWSPPKGRALTGSWHLPATTVYTLAGLSCETTETEEVQTHSFCSVPTQALSRE